jgi:peptide/nickel transport system substrate-binding protein
VLRRKGRPSRFLAAVVFTDIAGSTEVAARLGDEGWKRLLERHLRLVRSSLYRFGGREIDTAGDGLYATFESPARAIAFALDVAERDKALDIRVRSGVHMGEVELIGAKAGGIAVHIGARIAARAEPGEVLVSGTVRDLVTGSGIRFEDRGTAELKGVPGRWAIFAARALERPAELPPEARLPMRERISTRLRSTRARVLLVLVVLVALAGSAGTVFMLVQPRFLPGVEANSVGRISGDGRGIVSALQVGSVPDAIAFGAGSLWVTDTTTGSVARIDPTTSLVVETIPVRSSPNGVASGHGAIWVTNGNDRSVSRVSPLTNEVIDTIPVGNGPSGVATDEHWVWVTNRLDGTLARIDPQTGDAETFRIGTTLAGVAVGAGSVWVSDFDAGEVVRVDPATGVPFYRIPVGNGPTSIAAGDGQVWVVNSRDGTVSRIDPGTNSVAATIAVGAEPGVVAAGRSVWVTVSSTADIVQIDPATNLPVRRIPARSRPRGIVVAEGDAWFTARADTGSHRGGTLRIVGQGVDDVPSALDPAEGSDTINGLDHVFLTNDGLVGFERVGGSEGLTLVPDLAIAIPTPTDSGRTYSFKLRDGIIYSDGTPVHALDVRRSIERIFSINPDPLGFGGNLEGADACASAPATCDLSSSVIVDEGARTVTFRLIAPDPEFLFKLADPVLVVLPADTPRELATVPLPATGPYMAEPFDANGGIRLVRNPFFKEWSHEAQPDGYPDVIEWRIAAEGEDSTTLVAAGKADSTQWNDAFTAARIDELRTQFTDQLHALPPSRTWFQFMNTSRPPFDRAEVRRAVNLATDRNKVVELFGGDIAGRVTCQATPPGFPGYEPYCPYTVSPGKTWTAADMATAQGLIDSAGVRGTPVTVWSVEFARPEFRKVNAYFVELLNELGFEASLKSTSLEEFFAIEDEYTANIQMLGIWYSGLYPTPSAFIAGTFTCPEFRPFPGSDGNYAHFCDPEIDALALIASDLQATDPSLANQKWAEVDHKIVDQSPAVAAFNPIQLAFVSKRVGNVQVHPVLKVLISQMWVQ